MLGLDKEVMTGDLINHIMARAKAEAFMLINVSFKGDEFVRYLMLRDIQRIRYDWWCMFAGTEAINGYPTNCGTVFSRYGYWGGGKPIDFLSEPDLSFPDDYDYFQWGQTLVVKGE